MILSNKRDREAWSREKTLDSLKANTFLQENDIVQVAETGKFYKVITEKTDISLQNNLYAKNITNGSDKLTTPRNIAINGAVSGNADFDGSKNIVISTTLNNFDASKITSGTVDIDRLPKAVLERCVIVQNDEERFALTKEQVQNGDAVKVISPDNIMYAVIDDTKLNQEAGYTQYSAAVKWETIKDKPSEFTPCSHKHNPNDIKTDNNNLFVSLDEKDKWNLKANGDHKHDKVYAPFIHKHLVEEIIESETKKFISQEKLNLIDTLNNSLTKTITFNAGEGGTFADGETSKIVKVLFGSSFPSFPEIKQELINDFYGWQIEPYTDILDKTVTSDLTITALYQKPIYTITFKCNEGGTFRENNSDTLVKYITSGEKISIPEMIVPISYEFNGWVPELTENTLATGNVTYTANFNFLGINVDIDDSQKLFEKKKAKNDEYKYIKSNNTISYKGSEMFL